MTSILDQKPQPNAKKGIDGWIDGENGTILTSAYGYFKDSLEVHQDRPNSPLADGEKYVPPSSPPGGSPSPQQPPSPPPSGPQAPAPEPNKPGSLTISGEGKVGATLTASIDDADGVPSTVAYQWKRDSQNIANATSNTYTLTDDDKGKKITVSATYEDNKGNQESLTSDEPAIESGQSGLRQAYPQGGPQQPPAPPQPSQPPSPPPAQPQQPPASQTPNLDAAITTLKLPEEKTARAINYRGAESIKLNLLTQDAINYYKSLIDGYKAQYPNHTAADAMLAKINALNLTTGKSNAAQTMEAWEKYLDTINLLKDMKPSYEAAIATNPSNKADIEAAYKALNAETPATKQTLLDAIEAAKAPKQTLSKYDAVKAQLELPAEVTRAADTVDDDDEIKLAKLNDDARAYYEGKINEWKNIYPQDLIDDAENNMRNFDINTKNQLLGTFVTEWNRLAKLEDTYKWATPLYKEAIKTEKQGAKRTRLDAAYKALTALTQETKAEFNNALTDYNQ
jgi:putative uncharacterized protein (fragment)|nr:MAG TPA: Pre-mRNA-splicing factor 8, Pre-mRNA-splicing factor, B* complex, branching, snRNP [Caudoviricetes sp.]